MSGHVRNRGATSVGDLGLRVQRGVAVRTDRDARTALAGDETDEQVRPAFTTVARVLDPGDDVPFTLRVPLRGPAGSSLGLTEPGVYPLLVNANGQARHRGLRPPRRRAGPAPRARPPGRAPAPPRATARPASACSTRSPTARGACPSSPVRPRCSPTTTSPRRWPPGGGSRAWSTPSAGPRRSGSPAAGSVLPGGRRRPARHRPRHGRRVRGPDALGHRRRAGRRGRRAVARRPAGPGRRAAASSPCPTPTPTSWRRRAATSPTSPRPPAPPASAGSPSCSASRRSTRPPPPPRGSPTSAPSPTS